MGEAGCKVILVAYERALAEGCPVVGLWHSGGARLREGVVSLHAVGEVFAIMTRASGKVPQISVVLGPAAGGAAYGPALTDVVILGPEGRVFVTGPDVVRSVTGEDVDALRLGGPEPHGRRSGVVHVVADDPGGRLPRGAPAGGPARRPARDRRRSRTATWRLTCPSRASVPTTCTRSSRRCSTTSTSLELHPKWAPNVTTTLGRLGGRTVGVIANNPMRLGGCLDSASAEKAARFVRMCDAFGVPLVVVVDVPGYLPGVGQEWDGVVRRGAKLLHAFAEATVPRVTLVTRKAYGGAYIAMNSRSLGATRVFAWPGAEVAVMGAVAAVRILHRRRLAEVPEDVRGAGRAGARGRARAAGRRPRAARRRSGSSTRWSSRRRPGRRSRTRSSPRPSTVAAATTATSRSRGLAQTTWWSQRTGAPSPAYRNGSSSSSHAAPSRPAISSSTVTPGSLRRPGQRGAQPVLADQDVAVHADGGAEEAEVRGAGVALALAAGAGLLGDLEADQPPVAQRGGHRGGRAGLALPGQLGTHRARCGRLAGPVERDAGAENPADGPLDVRAQRRRGGVDVDNTASRHRDPPSQGARCAFPSGLTGRTDPCRCAAPIMTHPPHQHQGTRAYR